MLACACSEDSNQTAQSDQSFSFPPKEKLDHWLPIKDSDQTGQMCRLI